MQLSRYRPPRLLFCNQGRVQGDEVPDHWFIEEADEDRKIPKEAQALWLSSPVLWLMRMTAVLRDCGSVPLVLLAVKLVG